MLRKGTRKCQRVPEGARWYQSVPEGARGYQMVPEGARMDVRGCQRVPDGTNGCQVVPVSTRGCQKNQVGTVVAPGLGKTSDLIFVTVSIAGSGGGCPSRYWCHNVLLQVGMVPAMEGPPGRRDKVEG